MNTDFFIGARGTEVHVPSLLRQFADANSFEERASVLMANGYRDLRPIANANVRFAAKAQLVVGTVIHPEMKENFFGRVYGFDAWTATDRVQLCYGVRLCAQRNF